MSDRDPHGATACGELRSWLNGDVVDPKTGGAEESAIMSVAISDEAAQAVDPQIRATVGAPVFDEQQLALMRSAGGYTGGNFRFTNLRNLRDACSAAGEGMPAYTDTP